MPRRVKEGEKVEMIIRDLVKEEDNRRCINCNNLGPQYVCTTFWTFVCTNCSGVHREFNHRVKSVSAAKFNEEEITALQAGGNERAKQIYFKTWDPEHNAYPDTSNLQRLREFVNHVYIDRRYSGDNNSNKLSMVKLDSRRNSCEWPSEKPGWGRRDDFFQRSSFERMGKSGRDDYSSFEKSSSYENKKVLSLKDLLEERSPRHTQETPRSSSLRGRSTRIEIVDDRFREDGSVKTYERNSRRESRGGSISPGSQSSRTMSLPAIQPVSVILGEKVSELRIEGPPRPSGGKNAESSARVEKKYCPSSMCRVVRPGEVEMSRVHMLETLDIVEHMKKAATIPGPSEKQNNAANSSSLIDFFDTESDLPSSTAQPQAQPKASNESSSIASSSNQTVASVPNLLLDWSSPVASPSKAPETSYSFGALAITSTNNDQPFYSNIRNPIEQEIQMHQLPYKKQSHTFTSSPGNTLVESSPDQHWNKSPPPNDITPVRSASLEQPSHAANPEGSRKEIPQGLCTSNFTPFNPSVAGWPMHPSQGAGYGMQYHPLAMSVAVSPNPPKPRNPFDIGDNTFQVQEAAFPSISPLQGAPQTMPTSTALESHPSLYATALPSQPHVSPYGMNMPLVPGAWGQLSNNMPLTRPQGNVGRTEDALAPLNPIKQTRGTDSVPAGPTSQLPQVGNPFG